MSVLYKCDLLTYMVKRFSTIQITVQYRCVFVLYLGRCSLQLDSN